MWILKTKEELKKEKRKNRSILVPVGFSILIFLGGLIDAIVFRDTKVLGLDFGYIFLLLIASVVLGMLLWFLILTGRRIFVSNIFDSTPTVVCLICNKKKTNDDHMNCECGGRFEFMENLKWVDSK
jgi:hypothetical protein